MAGLFSRFKHDKNAKNIEWSNFQGIIRDLKEQNFKGFQDAELELQFPHKFLMLIYSKYLLYSGKPVAEKIRKSYHNSLLLFLKLKDAKTVEEWLIWVKRTEDKEAILANIRLKFKDGRNRSNIKLWYYYFESLKQNDNIKELLDAYKEYTEIFNDEKAIKNYRNEIEKFSIWNEFKTEYWTDTVFYEIKNGKIEVAKCLLEKDVFNIVGENVKIDVKDKDDLLKKLNFFDSEMKKAEYEKYRKTLRQKYEAKYGKNESGHYCSDYAEYILAMDEQTKKIEIPKKFVPLKQKPPIKQNLPFRRSFIQHLLKSANGYILRKLYASCKFFFSFFKAPLCYRLELSEAFGKNNGYKKYFQESLHLHINFVGTQTDFSDIQNFNVYGKLYCDSESRNFLSTALLKLYRCDVNRLCLMSQDLTFKEFKFIVTKNIIQIRFNNVFVYENEKRIDAIQLLKYAKQMPKFNFFEHINDKWFVCFSAVAGYQILPLLKIPIKIHTFETIFIENQEIKINKLRQMLNQEYLKSVYLINTTVKSASGRRLKRAAIKKGIESDVQNRILIVIK